MLKLITFTPGLHSSFCYLQEWSRRKPDKQPCVVLYRSMSWAMANSISILASNKSWDMRLWLGLCKVLAFVWWKNIMERFTASEVVQVKRMSRLPWRHHWIASLCQSYTLNSTCIIIASGKVEVCELLYILSCLEVPEHSSQRYCFKSKVMWY